MTVKKETVQIMNTLLCMCRLFLRFLTLALSLSMINGCKITIDTQTNMFQFECVLGNMTYDFLIERVMIYYWHQNNHDKGDYILQCVRFHQQADFNCSLPKPPFKWTIESRKFCLLSPEDPNRCLKVTANNSKDILGYLYACRGIPESMGAKKCQHNPIEDYAELPVTKELTPMTLTETTAITTAEKIHIGGGSASENTASRPEYIAPIIIFSVIVIAVAIACILYKRKSICRKRFVKKYFLNRKTKQLTADVEAQFDQSRDMDQENLSLLEGPTKEGKQTHLFSSTHINSKETPLKEGKNDTEHVSAERSSEKSKGQLILEGAEADAFIKVNTTEDFDVHDASKHQSEKAADETSGFSLTKEGKNAGSNKPYVSNPEQANLTDSVKTHLPIINPSNEMTLPGHNKAVHVNFGLAQHPTRLPLKTFEENNLHYDSNETMPSVTTAIKKDQLRTEQTEGEDLATDSEEVTATRSMFVRQSSVSAVPDSEKDDVSYKDTFSMPDLSLVTEAENVLSLSYYGPKISEVEERLKKINDVRDKLAVYEAFRESGKVKKNKALEKWLQEMDTLASRIEEQLHERMKDIRKANANEVVNEYILHRAQLYLNQLTSQTVQEQPTNPMSEAISVEQFNVGLRKRSLTETFMEKMQDADTHNRSLKDCLSNTENPTVEWTQRTQRGEEERCHPDSELTTTDEVLNSKLVMSVSFSRHSTCDSTFTDSQNHCNGANFECGSTYFLRGATADGRMSTACGQVEIRENQANVPMENSRLYAGSDQSFLNGKKTFVGEEDVEKNSPPFSVTSELSESSFMEVHQEGSVETP